jgi:Peptidase family C25/Secretion system C-terminal sorting domain/CARDB
VAGNTNAATDYFMYTVGRYFRTELNPGFAAINSKNLYSSSYDRGEGFTSRRIRPNGNSCGGQAQLPQTFPNLFPYLAGPSMTMRMNAVGSQPNSRSVRVNLNGDSITIFQMDYQFDAKVEEYNIPVSKINSGSAAFTIINQSTANCDEIRVAQIELTYPRQFNLGGNSSFRFSLPASGSGHYLKIANFNYGGIAPVLMDFTNGKRYVADITTPDTLKIILEPSTQQYELAIVGYATTTIQSIGNITQRSFTNYALAANQGDYLIISNPLIYGSGATNYVEQYRQYRASVVGGGFAAKTISIDDIEDQFAYGVKKHPLSIRNFLRYAKANFATQPKYAFLIGKGVSYNDYRANEANADANTLNLVPTWGYPASDNLFSSNTLTNASPSIPIGRLSVVAAQEVGDYLQKMKDYELAQKNATYTIANKSWMKNVIQIAGGGDPTIGAQIDGYLNSYKNTITDTLFGAKVKNFSKSDDPGGYPQAIVDFKNTYETGASLVTYFGHSSATSLDFNLDNPEAYNNYGKYPVFLVNGCIAGNLYEYEPQRFTNKTTLSEKFTLAANKGSIGYLASTHYGIVNYLDKFTSAFYKASSKTKYGQGFGDVIKEGITQVINQTGSLDFYARMHAEEFTFHGDPALKLNSSALPDFAIEQSQLTVTPSFISVADDSITVKTTMYNLGRAVQDSVNFKLTRQYPNGTTAVVFLQKIASVKSVDSLTIKLPIVPNRDKGSNTITASIDFDAAVTELSEVNNIASTSFIISEDELRPVFPYKYAIINASTKLVASTVNPLAASRQYKVEVDTTTLFNSPLKYTQTKTSTGGVVEFDNGIILQDGTVYYWRVSPVDITRWSVASFQYKVGAEVGFGQSHLYQHFDSKLDRVALDSNTRKWSFKGKSSNLFVQQSIYPTSGLEDNQFSVSVNGSYVAASACLGSSIIFNVFNPLTLKPWENTADVFGAMSTCDANRKNNFEYYALDTAYDPTIGGRRGAMKFFDSIPNGYIVVAKRNYDIGDADFASGWQADTAFYGSGNSLYHRFKNQGLPIDSFNAPRTFVFVFKKNDPSFTPLSAFSQGLYDRVTLSTNLNNIDTIGTITSPIFGPAKAWTKVQWAGSSNDGYNYASLKIIGIKTDKTEDVLYTLDTTQTNFNISAVNATQYPNIKLKLTVQDSILATPYQLNNWKVIYTPSAEGAIAPNLFVSLPDTVNTTTGNMLQLKVAFKNVSKVNFDSLNVKLVLYDSNNVAYNIPMPKTKTVLAGDTIHVVVNTNVAAHNGLYDVYLMVNPDGLQNEQYLFNNFLYKYVYIQGSSLPVTLTNFIAYTQGTGVNLQWQVNNEQDFHHYEIEYSIDGRAFTKLGIANASGASTKTYNYYHSNPVNGKNYYRLKMVNKDGSYTYSPIRLINFGKNVMVNVYPNPVQEKLQIAISNNANKPSTIKIANVQGQVMLTKTMTNFIEIDVRTWQAGTYIVQVDDGNKPQTFKIQKQ